MKLYLTTAAWKKDRKCLKLNAERENMIILHNILSSANWNTSIAVMRQHPARHYPADAAFLFFEYIRICIRQSGKSHTHTINKWKMFHLTMLIWDDWRPPPLLPHTNFLTTICHLHPCYRILLMSLLSFQILDILSRRVWIGTFGIFDVSSNKPPRPLSPNKLNSHQCYSICAFLSESFFSSLANAFNRLSLNNWRIIYLGVYVLFHRHLL